MNCIKGAMRRLKASNYLRHILRLIDLDYKRHYFFIEVIDLCARRTYHRNLVRHVAHIALYALMALQQVVSVFEVGFLLY